ncbi:MAG: hypothetical protein KDK78_07460 [Chlamydiia bacterium]|nr:hypothetical protein [Chlamydiia bacterium]
MLNTHTIKQSIPKRSHYCFQTKQAFEPGSEYFSLVYETPEGCDREDYSAAAWETHGKQRCEELEGVYWKGEVPPRKPKPQTPEEKEKRAMEVLKELLAQEGTESEAFVLSLYLRRRKKLLFKREKTKDGRLWHLCQISGTKQTLPILQIELTGIEIERVQAEIADRLRPPEEESVSVGCQEPTDTGIAKEGG